MHLDTTSYLGPTLNPHNTALSAGGSSGGEGALMGAKGSVLGIGTDIGGSVRCVSVLFRLRCLPMRETKLTRPCSSSACGQQRRLRVQAHRRSSPPLRHPDGPARLGGHPRHARTVWKIGRRLEALHGGRSRIRAVEGRVQVQSLHPPSPPSCASTRTEKHLDLFARSIGSFRSPGDRSLQTDHSPAFLVGKERVEGFASASSRTTASFDHSRRSGERSRPSSLNSSSRARSRWSSGILLLRLTRGRSSFVLSQSFG